MKHIHLETLRRAAVVKGNEYLNDCLKAGKIEGDYLLLTGIEYNRLRAKYPWGAFGAARMLVRNKRRAIDSRPKLT